MTRPVRMMLEQIVGKLSSITRGAENGELDGTFVLAKLHEIATLLDTPLQELKPVPRKTYTIDLKVNLDDESRFEIVKTIMRKAAQTVLTQVTMISDDPQRQPQVALRSEDFFEGTDELRVRDDQQAETAD